jgi:hypothetical protein
MLAKIVSYSLYPNDMGGDSFFERQRGRPDSSIVRTVRFFNLDTQLHVQLLASLHPVSNKTQSRLSVPGLCAACRT